MILQGIFYDKPKQKVIVAGNLQKRTAKMEK